MTHTRPSDTRRHPVPDARLIYQTLPKILQAAYSLYESAYGCPPATLDELAEQTPYAHQGLLLNPGPPTQEEPPCATP